MKEPSLSVALNFAAWLLFTALAFALLWTGRAPVWIMMPSVTWLLPSVDWVAVYNSLKEPKK